MSKRHAKGFITHRALNENNLTVVAFVKLQIDEHVELEVSGPRSSSSSSAAATHLASSSSSSSSSTTTHETQHLQHHFQQQPQQLPQQQPQQPQHCLVLVADDCNSSDSGRGQSVIDCSQQQQHYLQQQQQKQLQSTNQNLQLNFSTFPTHQQHQQHFRQQQQQQQQQLQHFIFPTDICQLPQHSQNTPLQTSTTTSTTKKTATLTTIQTTPTTQHWFCVSPSIERLDDKDLFVAASNQKNSNSFQNGFTANHHNNNNNNIIVVNNSINNIHKINEKIGNNFSNNVDCRRFSVDSELNDKLSNDTQFFPGNNVNDINRINKNNINNNTPAVKKLPKYDVLIADTAASNSSTQLGRELNVARNFNDMSVDEMTCDHNKPRVIGRRDMKRNSLIFGKVSSVSDNAAARAAFVGSSVEGDGYSVDSIYGGRESCLSFNNRSDVQFVSTPQQRTQVSNNNNNISNINNNDNMASTPVTSTNTTSFNNSTINIKNSSSSNNNNNNNNSNSKTIKHVTFSNITTISQFPQIYYAPSRDSINYGCYSLNTATAAAAAAAATNSSAVESSGKSASNVSNYGEKMNIRGDVYEIDNYYRNTVGKNLFNHQNINLSHSNLNIINNTDGCSNNNNINNNNNHNNINNINNNINNNTSNNSNNNKIAYGDLTNSVLV
ncbi:hypothetical protein HELRODRAFT_170462 [Helobdella robusta]|uniref:Uncharacterized protein n=1 Tax=Helobdella robusta TaxID=6412 RepID=T1F334_HELRO|nr:hypothetical protein HELRODRAFT_170462 [Helobdella robusta]ESO07155.1 hypothetical protein HELRODRAFT_170462 [Helobdella robusta]